MSVTERDRLVSFDLIRVVGQAINSGTDINVIAEAAGSCLSYVPLFEGKHQREGGGQKEKREQGGTKNIC